MMPKSFVSPWSGSFAQQSSRRTNQRLILLAHIRIDLDAPVAAEQPVVTTAAEQLVVAVVAADPVCCGPAVEIVLTGATVEGVGSALPVGDVVAGAGKNGVAIALEIEREVAEWRLPP